MTEVQAASQAHRVNIANSLAPALATGASVEMTTNADRLSSDDVAPTVDMFSGELDVWVATLDLSASASQKLVALLMGDDYGVTSTPDLLKLEDAHIQAVKGTLPIARRERFNEAIQELREVMVCVDFARTSAHPRTLRPSTSTSTRPTYLQNTRALKTHTTSAQPQTVDASTHTCAQNSETCHFALSAHTRQCCKMHPCTMRTTCTRTRLPQFYRLIQVLKTQGPNKTRRMIQSCPKVAI